MATAPIEDLVSAHLSYARALAHKIAAQLPPSVDRDELVGFAQLGLTQAAQAYDPDLGVAFTTFSYYRIRGAVFDGLRKMTWLPPAARKSVARQDAQDSLCEDGLGQVDVDATEEELAREFQAAVRSLGAVFLLGDADEDQNSEPVDPTSAAEEAEKRDAIARVREAIGGLDEKQANIVRMLYFEHLSTTEVAARLGVNKSTVSRAHARAIETLREALVT